MTNEERIRALEARAEIMELFGKYSMGVARRDREEILQCFTPDGVFEVGAVRLSGVAEIREYLRDMKPDTPHLAGFDRATGSTPTTSNILIELNGDAATSTSTCVVCHAGSREGKPIVMVRGTEYEDELAVVDGAWRFSRRHHRTVWEFEANGVEPTAPPKWPR